MFNNKISDRKVLFLFILMVAIFVGAASPERTPKRPCFRAGVLEVEFANASQTLVQLDFPAFPTTPVVVASGTANISDVKNVTATALSPTSAGIIVELNASHTGTTLVNWIAACPTQSTRD